MCKVSIIIPVFNKSQTIVRAIDSVINQDYNDCEIIVVDDGSTDGSLTNLPSKYRSLLKIIVQKNSGVSVARNVGAANASGDLIAFLDADDELSPRAISMYMYMSTNFPNANFFSIGFDIVSEYGILYKPSGSWAISKIALVDNFALEFRHNTALISSSTACIRRQAFIDSGGFPAGKVIGEDIYLWLKLSLTHSLCHAGESLAKIYRNADNRSLDTSKNSKQIHYFLEYFLSESGISYYNENINLRRLLFILALKNLLGAKEFGNNYLVLNIANLYQKRESLYRIILLVAALLPRRVIRIIRYLRSIVS
jgi:glycosyltransferase involved in cell wall biosynthesis